MGQPSNGDESPSIIKRSPFLPPDFKAPTNQPASKRRAAQKAANYEFKGVYQLNGVYHLLVSEKRTRTSQWVSIGDETDGFSVRSYNPEAQSVTLFFDNKEQVIELAQLNPNPTPKPVRGQPSAKPAVSKKTSDNKKIRPTVPAKRTTKQKTTRRAPPPPPAWLKELQERKRQSGTPSGLSGSSRNSSNSRNPSASGSMDSGVPIGPPPGPPPTSAPPTAPPDFLPPGPPPMDFPPGPPPEFGG